MKRLIFFLMILAGFAMQASAYDFQSGNLLYTIISTDPPQVSIFSHADGQAAQGELVIPETVTHEGITYTVTVIGKNAFSGCLSLSGNLVIPNTIEEIKAGAFYDCSGFTGNLVIPNSVTKMNIDNSPQGTVPGAFENCTGFNGYLDLSDSLEIIGDAQGGGCFSGCVNLTGVLVIPNSVTYVGESAFDFCSGFTGTVVIPESVTEIGHHAFGGCSGIEDVVFSDTPLLMGSNVFNGCTSLTDIDIPEGWTTTGVSTFQYCTNLRKVHLPESLTEIDYAAFEDCPNLADINFPNNLRTIGMWAFCNCVSLESLDLPDSLVDIFNGAFSGCAGLSGDLVISNHVERLRTWVFQSCTGIKHLVLGESLNYIMELAFQDTDIEAITIKATVPPELDGQAFGPNNWHFGRDIPVIVPCGTLEAYHNAEGWSEFTNIQEGVTNSLMVVSSDEYAGTVNIIKEATCDDRLVEVEALPNEGCKFLYWEANGEQVSYMTSYSFMLEEDTELVAYFSCSNTGMNESGETVSVYPNPAREKVTVEGMEVAEMQVFNTVGQLVKTVRGTNEVGVNDMQSGVYVLRIMDTAGVSCVERVTVVR